MLHGSDGLGHLFEVSEGEVLQSQIKFGALHQQSCHCSLTAVQKRTAGIPSSGGNPGSLRIALAS